MGCFGLLFLKIKARSWVKTFKSRLIYTICVLFCFICLFGCAKKTVQHNLIKSTVELDRFYIPTLVFANLQKERESEIAMQRMQEVWGNYYRKFHGLEIKYGVNITDKDWKEDFIKADELVSSAEGLVKDKQLVQAYEKLVRARGILRDLRRRNGVEYFLDGMTEFHDAMDQISSVLRGKAELSAKDLKALRRLFKKAQNNWAEVGRAELDPVLFGFDADKVDAVDKRVKHEERMIATFAAALSSTDDDRIFQAAQDLKPNFIVLYKAFGDFQPIFDIMIEERKEEEAKDEK